jgi:chemotaxis signal transduction protein
VATLGATRIALPLTAVAAVAMLPPIVPLPLAPAYVRGITAWRGQAIPVLDIAPLLGEPAVQGDLALVCQHGSALAALLVAHVHGEAALVAAPGEAMAAGPRRRRGARDATTGAGEPTVARLIGRPARAEDGGAVDVLDINIIFALANLSAVLD